MASREIRCPGVLRYRKNLIAPLFAPVGVKAAVNPAVEAGEGFQAPGVEERQELHHDYAGNVARGIDPVIVLLRLRLISIAFVAFRSCRFWCETGAAVSSISLDFP